jgi:hypothetical protein
MDYEGFKAVLAAKVEEREGNGAAVRLHRVRKNNGVMLDGLTIMREGENVSPTIYLEPFYERYRNGARPDDLADDVLALYRHRSCSGRVDAGMFEDYKRLASGIRFRLVNYEMNRDMLSDVPHRRFLDLAAILYCDVSDSVFSTASVLVQNDYAKRWGVSHDELFDTAMKNMLLHEPAGIWPMGRMLAELRGTPEENILPELPLYVLTNRSRMFGAACMMYPGVFDQAVMEIRNDFYVLPSSVHEVLLLSPDQVFDGQGLGELVRRVNEEQVEPYEVLSNNVYYYDSKKREIEVCGQTSFS